MTNIQKFSPTLSHQNKNLIRYYTQVKSGVMDQSNTLNLQKKYGVPIHDKTNTVNDRYISSKKECGDIEQVRL